MRRLRVPAGVVDRCERRLVLMSDLERVLTQIDRELDHCLERLFALLRIPSISTDPSGQEACRAAAQYIASDLRSIGLLADVRSTGGHPVVLATSEGAGP